MTKLNNNNSTNNSPIIIPTDSYLEGYLKSKKSIRIECSYTGTILSTQKVIIDSYSVVKGDVICKDLTLLGKLTGNVFCTGKVKLEKDSILKGKIYTALFENDMDSNMDCIIQIPTQEIIGKLEDLLNNISSDIGLSQDETLSQIRNTFYENVFTRKTNPDEPFVSKFTEQVDIVKKIHSFPEHQDKQQQENK